MDDYLHAKELCHICKHDLTTIHAEITPGRHVFVCAKCLETAKQNFIWICMQCGNVYIRPKSLVIGRLKDPELKRAYAQCAHMQIIQGIDGCIECNAERIRELVAGQYSAKQSGHC